VQNKRLIFHRNAVRQKHLPLGLRGQRGQRSLPRRRSALPARRGGGATGGRLPQFDLHQLALAARLQARYRGDGSGRLQTFGHGNPGRAGGARRVRGGLGIEPTTRIG